MSLANLIGNSLGTLLDSPVINFLGNLAGKPVLDVLKSHFTFSTLEITRAYQRSYVQILNAIRLGLRSSTWKKLLSDNVKKEFANQIIKDYFKPFADSQQFSTRELNAFALKLYQVCQILIKHEKQLFQLQNNDLELGLIEIIHPHQSLAITELLIGEISKNIKLDQDIIAFFRYKELLGNGLLYFFHEQLRRDERLQSTFLALKQEGLWIDIRNVQKSQQQLMQIVNQQQLQVKPPQVLFQMQQLWQQQLGDFQNFSLQFKGFVDVISRRLELIAQNINDLHLKTDRILELLLELKQKDILSEQQVLQLIESTHISNKIPLKQKPALVETTLKQKPALVETTLKQKPALIETTLKQKPALIETTLKQKLNLQSFNFKTVYLDKVGQIISSMLYEAKQFTEDLGKGVALEMVYIPGGKFLMGAAKNELGSMNDETPQHWVEINAFFISKYPITQMQWFLVMKQGFPCHFHGSSLPVEKVSWFQTLDFCRQLSQKTSKIYRLPTEAEWEYACRSNTLTPFHFGETITTDVANYDGNYNYINDIKTTYQQMTVPIGIFPPNVFGIYDMHGNIWEWTCSEYSENYGEQLETKILNQQQAIDKRMVVRGGSWYSSAVNCRSANRYHVASNSWDNDIGFRVVISAYFNGEDFK
jgi:formylglycine-generating enzyme required for sulfatase activity